MLVSGDLFDTGDDDGVEVFQVHEAAGPAEAADGLAELRDRAAVKPARGDKVPARPHQREQRHDLRGVARGTADRPRAAFQRGAIDAWVIWDPFLAEVETNAKARQIGNAEGLVPHYTFYLASRKFADTYPDTAKQVVDELGKLSEWANSHQDDAAGILSTSTGLDKAIWLKTLARLPYGAERMTPAVYNEQQALADTFTRIGLLPVKVDVRSATWSLDKQ